MWSPRNGVRRVRRFALARDCQDASFQHLMRTAGYRPEPDPSPLFCVGSLWRSPDRIRQRTTRKRSPELVLNSSNQDHVVEVRCEGGRRKPAQRLTIPQDGAMLNQRMPDRADAGWRISYRHTCCRQRDPYSLVRQAIPRCLAAFFEFLNCARLRWRCSTAPKPGPQPPPTSAGTARLR